ncbi:enterochelin esterase-like enzyme [Staphylococcus auricularis]|uniref:Esterase family protein n=1 Tax=Staphylococcus auricularis TaxID=29379 RepID=A0AAP8TTP5_9STAP|nr:alpha/beta hydrolase-fold protein [Staphylococcus auricularis]MBM0868819.1 esterase family protein [Staphylococcus auricularis]MCG7341466.1 esterase family protein [Staphylococcus auricularis]MDC6326321.1 alpha/beta hydrolase-fold protein [Staphylococcus auricularis]PNZ68658.1 esterase family protein [Staphylococcus auricularis]QPT05667.1 esterase family protein [Staphylococcus auricularis]
MTTFKPGEVTRVNFTSDILNRDITLSIYLPKDYSALRQYKIIFCFDGRDFFSFGQIHRKYEKLRQTKRIDDAIFVGFHYESVDKRREEFHPQGDKAPLTVKTMAQELLPYVEAQFPTYHLANSRILLGDSLAGSIALLTALSYPRIFSQVGVLSPQHDDVLTQLLDRCQFKSNLTIWQAVGKEESDFALPTTGKRADFLTPNRTLHEHIAATEITHHYEEFEGGHRWKSWQGILDDLLLYFLSDEHA